MYKRFVKRCLDFLLSLIALIILSPVRLIVAILVRCKLGSPIIFKQQRPGLHEKIFCMYKFRTMTDAKDEQGNLLPDEVRLTKFGKALRSTSLDELPELFNILKVIWRLLARVRYWCSIFHDTMRDSITDMMCVPALPAWRR